MRMTRSRLYALTIDSCWPSGSTLAGSSLLFDPNTRPPHSAVSTYPSEKPRIIERVIKKVVMLRDERNRDLWPAIQGCLQEPCYFDSPKYFLIASSMQAAAWALKSPTGLSAKLLTAFIRPILPSCIISNMG